MKRLALSLLLLVTACHPKVNPGRAESDAGVPLAPGAVLATVEARPVAPRIDVIGTVSSERIVTLSSRLSAYVQDVAVSAGDRVKTGQVLLTLDDREIREQLAAAEAQLKQAESEFKRAQQLLEKTATTPQAFTAAESAYNTARAQVERVKVMLTYAAVTSPIDGVVTERRVEAGDLANPGQPLLAVYDPTRMRLEAPVPARLVARLALGQAVEVTLDQTARGAKGEVSEIVSEIDPLSRTRKVKIRLIGAGDDVLPGAFGRLWIEEEPRPMILIPAAAVQRVGQLDMVHVAQGQRALRRLVRTGPARGDEVEILSGLQPGESVVVAGAPSS